MQTEANKVGALIDLIKPDFSKMDKAKEKSAVDLAVAGLKGTTTWPADLDDTLVWDNIALALRAMIDKVAGVNDDPHQPTVGAEAPPTMGEINEFFSSTGLEKGSEVGKRLLRHPEAVAILRKNFTADEQKQLVGNPLLIGLLTILGPLVLDLLKAWLAKLNKTVHASKPEKSEEEKHEKKEHKHK